MSIDPSACRTISEVERHNLSVRKRGADRARYREFCARCQAEGSFSPHDLRRAWSASGPANHGALADGLAGPLAV